MSDILRPAGRQPTEEPADEHGTMQADSVPERTTPADSGPGLAGPLEDSERHDDASGTGMEREPADMADTETGRDTADMADMADTETGRDTADMADMADTETGRDTADMADMADMADTETGRDTADMETSPEITGMGGKHARAEAAEAGAYGQAEADAAPGMPADEAYTADRPAAIDDLPTGGTLAASTDAHEAETPAPDVMAADTQPATDVLVASPAHGDTPEAGTQGAGTAGAQVRPQAADAVADIPLLGDAAQVHQRWQEIQASFVDDPHGSVNRAANLAEEVADALISATQQRMRDLRNAWDGDGADTEQLRATLRNYRVLINRISGV
jgi:hypothetical protein